MKKIVLLSASLSLVFASLAFADPVDNPGDFTLDFDAGRIKIGSLDPSDFAGVSFAGTVLDTAGNISASVAVSDITISGTPLGDVTLHFVSLSDVVGSLDALTGLTTLSVSLQMFLVNPNFPPECRIDQMDIALTADIDGTLTGILYDMTDGIATYVNNSFLRPHDDRLRLRFWPFDRLICRSSRGPRGELDRQSPRYVLDRLHRQLELSSPSA